MFVNLMRKFWADECGAVIATEYLMLGSIVAVGGTTGLVSMRDAMNAECQEFGNSVREIRQASMPKEYRKLVGGQSQRQGDDEIQYVPLSQYGVAP